MRTRRFRTVVRLLLWASLIAGCSQKPITATTTQPTPGTSIGGSTVPESEPGTTDSGPICNGFSTVVSPDGEGAFRNSEGDVVALEDGSLFLVYTEFAGTGDHSQARIVSSRSKDGGRTWTPPEPVVENPDGLRNAMIGSLLRLQDGTIMLGYNKQIDLGDSRFYVKFSRDEARSWGPEVSVISEKRFGFVYNFAPTQLASGRIIAPYAFNEEGDYQAPGHFVVTAYYSDDNGQTWVEGESIVDLPMRGAMEPGVIEIAEPELYMWLRTQLGVLYTSRSNDGGRTWSDPVPTTLRNPEAPSAITMLPDHNLLAVYNDNYNPEGPHHFGRRFPLAAAKSTDLGESWAPPVVLGDKPGSEYSYAALEPTDSALWMTYGETVQTPSGAQTSFVFRSITYDELSGACWAR